MSEEMVPHVPTAPAWNQSWGISEEAASHLWELAAGYVLEIEDSTHETNVSRELIWKELHVRHPEWYPERPPHTLRDHWWGNDGWKSYLAIRRQEHLLRTMPTRFQIKRYYSHLHDLFADMLIQRAVNDPDSFSNAQALAVLKEANSGLMAIDDDIKKASGEETGRPIKVDVFQFLEKMPRDRQNVIIGKLVRERVAPALDPGNDD